MPNVTFTEWEAHIESLAVDLNERTFPVEVKVERTSLHLHVGGQYGLSASVTLRGGRKTGSMAPHTAFDGGPAIVGSVAMVEVLSQDLRTILDAMHYAIAHTEKYIVWGKDCPCDRCDATGKGVRGKPCEVCGGEGTRETLTTSSGEAVRVEHG